MDSHDSQQNGEGAGEGGAESGAPVDVARLEAFAASLTPAERAALLGILTRVPV